MKKIIIIFIVVVLVIFFSVLFIVLNNDKYYNSIEKEIKNNYVINDSISYLNKSSLYYVILTNKNLIVLDNEFQEIFKEDINNIRQIDRTKEIVYRLNNVMYEEKSISNDKIIYNYYDIYTNELIDSLEIGG